MKKSLIAVMVAFGLFLNAFVTSSAMAGSYAIGIIAATGKVDTKGSETEGSASSDSDNEITTTEHQEEILYGSLFAEYTWGEKFGLTLGASYTPINSSIGTKSRTDSQTASDALDTAGGSDDSGTYTAEAEISDHATLYIEPTFMPSDNFGVFLKGGVSRVTVKSLETIALGEDSSAYGNENVLGRMFGVGAKIQHDGGLMFKVEYTKTMYDEVTMTSTSGNKNTIKADPEIEAVRLSIGYRF